MTEGQPSYKLIYFNARGRAEHIRYIFAYAGIDYVDERISKERWPELKKYISARPQFSIDRVCSKLTAFVLSDALWNAACAGDRRETDIAEQRRGKIFGEETQSNRKGRMGSDAVRRSRRYSWGPQAIYIPISYGRGSLQEGREEGETFKRNDTVLLEQVRENCRRERRLRRWLHYNVGRFCVRSGTGEF
nr:PREDICTED: uncharacterized protein LOC100881277 isoform X3 [Megachile rotundata]